MAVTGPDDDRARRIPHVPALDGLRGLAVGGVLLFHAGHLQGGFLGVDLFFTLSGYLITSLLVVERERTGAVCLRRFWGRRIRRLLPALVLVIAASAALAPAVLRSGELGQFRTLALATLAYGANWVEVARAGDYFALFDTATPLDHAWSLAIEEQFYLVWPLLVVAAARFTVRPRVGIRVLTAVGIVASLTASWWVLQDPDGITRAYYGTDTRSTSILVGAALATVTAGVRRPERTAEQAAGWMATAALVVIAASWVAIDGTEPWLYRWGLLAHAALTAVVVAAMSGPTPGVVGTLLTNRVLVRLGVLSYGLYLWHWPTYLVLDPERTGLAGTELTVVRVAASVALAEVSYRLVEAPIRFQRYRVPRQSASALAAMASAAALVLLLVRPPPERLPPVSPVVPASVATGGVDDPSGRTAEIPPLRSVLLVGDSQAETLAFNAPGSELGLRIENGANLGCGLSSRGIVQAGERVAREEECAPVLADMRAQVADSAADLVVVLSSIWESFDQVVDGTVVPFGGSEWAALVREDFVSTVGPMAATHEVVLLTAPCVADGLKREEYGLDDVDQRVAAVNEVYGSAAADLDIPVIDLAGHVCPGGTPVTAVDGHVLRPDGVHFEAAGARIVWPWLAVQLHAVRDEVRRG